jgi:nitrogen fixation/metabolism regulation signal transduction histidine kinase
MQTETSKPKRRSVPWLLGLLVLALLTFLILLQSSNLWKNFSVETASDTLLLYALSSLNFIAFVIFGFIFLRSIIKLGRERRTLELGSKIKTRLLIYFFAVSLLPIVAMAVFSYLFMNRAIERWFTNIPETVLRQARDLQNQALDNQSAGLRNTVQMLASVLDKRDFSKKDLDAIAASGNFTRIEVLSKENKTLEVSGRQLPPEQNAELERTLDYVRQGNFTEPLLQDGKGFDAAVAALSDGRKIVIVPDIRPDASVSNLADKSLDELDRLKEQQITVRQIGFLTLGVLTFLLIFASSWTAFYIARGLTIPIKALAEGADEIAQGNLSHRVNVFAEDELALLISTFNAMSAKLEENSAELSHRRKYIETVLQSLPNGVISFDGQNRVSTINRSAINILKLENADFGQVHLDQLVSEENRVVIDRLLSRAKRIGHAAEQTVLRRENADGNSDSQAETPVALIASALPDEGGVVLVIEDLSELIAAQRASAWQEVARRMAHEIKNPLTPIQLSAERIAKRFDAGTRRRGDAVTVPPAVAGGFLNEAVTTKQTEKTRKVQQTENPQSAIRNPQSDEQTSKIIREGTDTILREVQSLKSMVDEFSRFARLPSARLEQGDVNEVINQAASLYQDRADGIKIDAGLATDLPSAMIDPEQLKRVFVNLIENAAEAFDPLRTDKRIMISTRFDSARDLIVAEVSDNGRGIAPADFQRLFQPYFSTKGRGTGLGLAIVQRIITEHSGKIRAANNAEKGAKFIIEIPVTG